MKSEAERYRYWAFISYSHADEGWAKWLHRAIETWRVPQRLVGQPHPDGEIPRRLRPLFRDRDELSSSAELGGVLNRALRESRYLIVICSPRAAASRWIDEEVRYFKSLGRESRVLALIADGEPGSGDGECFPLALRRRVGADGELLTDSRVEPIAADARPQGDGRQDALVRLLAGMLNLGFDDLRQRERRRRFWQRVQQTSAIAALLVAVSGAWMAFERYKREQALAAHIEKVYETGRTELLAGRDMRAAVYLAEAYRLGLDTPALRFMLARAMAPLDAEIPVRIDAGGPVRRPLFSPDGSRLVTPIEDPALIAAAAPDVPPAVTHAAIWDVATGALQGRLDGLPRMPQILTWLPDAEHLLVSGFQGYDDAIGQWEGYTPITQLWNTRAGEKRFEFEGHAGRFGMPVDAAGSKVVLADMPHQDNAQVRELTGGRLLFELRGDARIRAAGFSIDGSRIYSGDADGRVLVWDARNGNRLALLPGAMSGEVVAVVPTPDDRGVIAVGRHGDLRLWNVATGTLELAFAADSHSVADIRFSSDASRLMTVGQGGYRVWSLLRGSLEFERRTTLARWASADFSAQGQWLLTAPSDQPESELWLVPGQRRLTVLEQTDGNVSAAIFSSDQRRMAVADAAGRIRLYRLPIHQNAELSFPPKVFASRFIGAQPAVIVAGPLDRIGIAAPPYDTVRTLLELPSGPVHRLAASDDGDELAVGDGSGRLRTWRMPAVRARCDVQANASGFFALVYSADGRWLASSTILGPADTADTVHVLATASCARQAQFKHPCTVVDLDFSPDSRRLMSSCTDGRTFLWEVETGKALQTLTDGGLSHAGAQFVHGRAKRIVEVLDRDEVRLIDLETGSVEDRFDIGHGEDAYAGALSEGGDFWVAATNTGRIYVKHRERAVRQAGALPYPVHSVVPLTGPLMLMAAAGTTGRLSVWDAASAQMLAEVAVHADQIWDFDIGPDYRQLLTGGRDGAARLWSLALETRSATEIDARIRCASPWTLQGQALVRASQAAAPGCTRD